MAATIYVADDDKHILALILRFLENEGFSTQGFDTGDALYLAHQNEPADLIILDIMMPGTDGLTLCSLLRKESHVPLVLLSAKETTLDRITGISAGADDYLIKPFSPLELVVRVKAILRRTQNALHASEKDMLQRGDLLLHLKKRRAHLGGEVLDLSPLEFDFLAYLLTHPDRAVSREELLEKVWGYPGHADTRATDDLVKRLRRKIATSSVSIASVWGVGFRLDMEEGSS